MHYAFYQATGITVSSFRNYSDDRVRLLDLALLNREKRVFVVLYEIAQALARFFVGYVAFLPVCLIYIFIGS